jgi:hypothetical protein
MSRGIHIPGNNSITSHFRSMATTDTTATQTTARVALQLHLLSIPIAESENP